MKSLLLLLFTSTFICALSQDVKVEKNVVYGNSLNYLNRPEDLRMDIYHSFTGKMRPLIVFMHGGGFANGSKDSHSVFCSRLAANGYNVANVDYRIGFDSTQGAKSLGIVMASYRAAQDLDAALRYLLYHAADYGIDTSAVFLSGESAGAVTILSGGFVSQSDWDKIFPTLHQQLGPIQGSGNNLVMNYHIKGLISLWGAIYDTTLISDAEIRSLPLLLIQSRSDEVLPFEHSKAMNVLFPSVYGSMDIARRYQSAGGCASLYYTSNAHHFFGFSQQYVVNAINMFVDDVLNGTCRSFMIENKKEVNTRPFSNYEE